MMRRVPQAFAFLLFFATLASAVDSTVPTTRPAITLKRGDVVEFTIPDLFGPGVTIPLALRVDAKGEVKLPVITAVAVAGQTTDAAAACVSEAYEKAQVITKTVVTASIVSTAEQNPIKPGPLAVGDVVRVTVIVVDQTYKRVDVDAVVADDGTITLPRLGKVTVAGQNDNAATETITTGYKKHKGVEFVTLFRLSSAP